MERTGKVSYYDVLGVCPNSSLDEIKRAYRKLAMQWHPDKWARTPCLLGEAKLRFQQIQEAYSVLSDPRKRTLLDMGLYDPREEYEEEDDDDDVEGFSDFMQEMLDLIAQEHIKDKTYTMEELQIMFLDMWQGFESSSPWNDEASSSVHDPDRAPRNASRCDPCRMMDMHFPGFGWYGTQGDCN